MEIKINQKTVRFFTEDQKHKIIHEFLSTQCSKVEVWKKFTGQAEEHGQILRWMKQLGYNTEKSIRRPYIVSNLDTMAQKIKSNKPVNNEVESFENLQLLKRIAELEKQLKDAELKAIAFSTMVDIAEKEFKIPIRKKFNTKP